MTFIMPAIHNSFPVAPASNTRWNSTENTPTSAGVKSAGGLPITTNVGDWERDKDVSTSPAGFNYEFQAAQAGFDVSVDTKLLVWHSQNNAPNRIQVDAVANFGFQVRVWTGAGAPPAQYRSWYIGGNNTPMSASISGQYPFVIDLNDSGHDAFVGTYDNTDVTTFAIWMRPFAMAGSASSWCYQAALYIVDTTKASADTPHFTGASGFDDAVTLIQGTTFSNKLGNWVRQIGTVVFVDLPWKIGDNSTSTQFNDDGLTVVSPASNDPADPRNRLTVQAMRTYLNLRSNALDTASFSGTYIWGTRAAFDWDQDDLAIVTFASPTFTGMGTFTLGSSVTGPATWDDVDPVVFADSGVDVDGSTFKNQNGPHALQMNGGAQTIANMRFETYAAAHAIRINTAGTYTFSNVFFDQSGTNDVENTSGGLVTINVTGGGTVPTITNTGGGSTTTVNTVVPLLVEDVVANSRVAIHDSSDVELLNIEAVSATEIMNEGFEGTGFELTWVETPSTGSIDPDKATSAVSGAPGDWGDDCLEMVSVAAGITAASHEFSQDENVAYCQFEIIVVAEGLADGEGENIATLTDSSDLACIGLQFLQVAGVLQMRFVVVKNGATGTVAGVFDENNSIHPFAVGEAFIYEWKFDTVSDEWEVKVRASGATGETVIVQESGTDLTAGANIPRKMWCGQSPPGGWAAANTFCFDRVRVNTAGYPEDASDLVDVSGTFNYSSDTPVTTRVRKQSRSPRYEPVTAAGTILVGGLTVPAGQIADAVAQ